MGCPDPGRCPVVDVGTPSRLRSHVIDASTPLYNVSRHGSIFNGTGRGNSRFSPLGRADGSALPHVYLAQNPFAALLESALHSAWGTARRVRRSTLRGLSMRVITCRAPLRVADIRDAELQRLGIRRDQLVASSPEHYGCTRDWARSRSRLRISGQTATGFIWNSRQAELAAANAAEPVASLLTVADQTTETVIVYDHDQVGDSLFSAQTRYQDLSTDTGLSFVVQSATILGLFVDD